MAYKIRKLKSFDKSAFEADSNLYALSTKAADRFFEDYNRKTKLIEAHYERLESRYNNNEYNYALIHSI